MNSLLGLATLGLSSWPLHYPYWLRGVRKTPDIQLSQDVKTRLEQETIAKSAAKRLKREQNKERDKKK